MLFVVSIPGSSQVRPRFVGSQLSGLVPCGADGAGDVGSADTTQCGDFGPHGADNGNRG